MKRPPLIAVIGGSEVTPDIEALAEAVGRELARRGAVVLCGGLTGVMQAVCRGASAEGGLTIGILPGADREEANPYVQVPIVTGLRWARNVIVALSGQAIIAIDGSYGTLSEIAFALQAEIPVIGLHTWSLQDPVGQTPVPIIPAEDPVDAVEKALAAIAAASSVRGGPA
jgi:uncharacterized protein (TIGR00725 family)